MLDAAPEMLRRAQAYAIDCAPDLLDDKSRRLTGVARQRDLGPSGGLDLSRAHAGQPSGPLLSFAPGTTPVLDPTSYPALRQREHATCTIQLLRLREFV